MVVLSLSMVTFSALPVGEVSVFKFEAALFADQRAAGQDGDVFQHGCGRSPKPGAFTAAIFRAADLVHHQRSQGFAVNFPR